MRSTGKQGPQEPVYGANGLPLFLPLDAEIDDLKREVNGESGRYLLVQVDEQYEPIANVAQALVVVKDPPPAVNFDEVSRTLRDELAELRKAGEAKDRMLLDVVGKVSRLLESTNLQPLEAFKRGMEHQRALEAGVEKRVEERVRALPVPEVTDQAEEDLMRQAFEVIKPIAFQVGPKLGQKLAAWIDKMGEAPPVNGVSS